MSEFATTTTATLGDALPKEIDRCIDLLMEYRSIGTAGHVGAWMIRSEISAALSAIAQADTIAMIQSYQKLALFK